MAWLPVLPHHGVCLALREWAGCRGSLTEKLRAAFPDLQVELVRQARAAPNPDEYAPLGLPPPLSVWIREVVLHSRGTPLVFAHTVLPHAYLRGAWHLFGGLGARPLGEVLFADPRIRRGPLRFCALGSRHPLHREAQRALPALALPATLWARRSVFERGGHPVLVSEVFLPALTSTRA